MLMLIIPNPHPVYRAGNIYPVPIISSKLFLLREPERVHFIYCFGYVWFIFCFTVCIKDILIFLILIEMSD